MFSRKRSDSIKEEREDLDMEAVAAMATRNKNPVTSIATITETDKLTTDQGESMEVGDTSHTAQKLGPGYTVIAAADAQVQSQKDTTTDTHTWSEFPPVNVACNLAVYVYASGLAC